MWILSQYLAKCVILTVTNVWTRRNEERNSKLKNEKKMRNYDFRWQNTLIVKIEKRVADDCRLAVQQIAICK